MKDILLAWIAGSGKGTQARSLEKELWNQIQYFEPWSIFRALTSNDNIVWDYAKAYTSVGKLLPDDFMKWVLGLVFASLEEGRQLLIDWFPRMHGQKRMFDEVMQEHQRDFIIFHLDIADDIAYQRLLHRKICANCGTTYSNIIEPGITHCHHDNTALTTRVDDQSKSAIQERFALYHTETKPLLDEYAAQGKVVNIDWSLSIDNITEKIIKHLDISL